MIREIINNKKGITLVSLVVSVVILLILSTISIYSIKSADNINPYNNMIADINLLEDKIKIYYNKYSEIPKTSDVIEIEGVKYYKIDLSKLENITLNFGTNEDSEDYYLVNSNLEVYYKKGVKKGEEVYHTK